MSSEADIANAAGVLIGDQPRITALDDDRNLARTLKAVWELNRRATIRDGSWNFASQRASLAADTDVVGFPWEAGFPVPAQCLRLLEVLNAESRDAYSLEGGRILCNSAGPLYVRFLVDVPELAQWDEAATDAFAHRLAWKCGRRIAGSAFDVGAAERAYRYTLQRAKHVDAAENPTIDQEDSSWVAARYGARW